MRILIVSQYFAPEINAAANRVHAFAAGLVRRGHDVEVVCEVPHHPVGVVATGYGGRLVDRREMDGARSVTYGSILLPRRTPAVRVLANYVSFGLTGTIVACAVRRADVILASSPPLPVGGWDWRLAVRPAPAVGHGCPRPMAGRRVALGQWARGHCCARLNASSAGCTDPPPRSRSPRSALGSPGRGPRGCGQGGGDHEWDHWGIPGGGRPLSDARSYWANRDDLFRWTYAGNLGMVAGLETAIDAARELGEGFQLVLIGDGSRAERLSNGWPQTCRRPGRVSRRGPAGGGSRADARLGRPARLAGTGT